MVKWEYGVLVISSNRAIFEYGDGVDELTHKGTTMDTIRHLNNFGHDGWEAIQVSFENGFTIYQFKRPVSKD